jgi:hypothetical protein
LECPNAAAVVAAHTLCRKHVQFFDVAESGDDMKDTILFDDEAIQNSARITRRCAQVSDLAAAYRNATELAASVGRTEVPRVPIVWGQEEVWVYELYEDGRLHALQDENPVVIPREQALR